MYYRNKWRISNGHRRVFRNEPNYPTELCEPTIEPLIDPLIYQTDLETISGIQPIESSVSLGLGLGML